MKASPINSETHLESQLQKLRETLEGDLWLDQLHRKIYATDASVYQELPLAVALPRSTDDLRRLIEFARKEGIGLIPRTAGTSLAGQVVGGGIVVDVSRYLNQILEINPTEGFVRVQPGVIRNELNQALQPYGLMFGPETSTANRAMIGGMIGNNSCGSNSIVYGSTRESLLEVRGFLSDGSEVLFQELTSAALASKRAATDGSLETAIYRGLFDLLSDPETREEIRRQFPKREIRRRNTGYAVDVLAEMEPFAGDASADQVPFNLCQLIAGSEGTLMFVTEAKLRLVPLPPPVQGVMCGHFDSIQDALTATRIAMQHQPHGCELIDHFVLAGAARNLEQQKNLEFLAGQPQAILIVEFCDQNEDRVAQRARQLQSELQQQQLGYAFPLLFAAEADKVWNLRKSGLGVIQNIPGDTKPVAVIEDTAVALEDLPDYIRELSELLRARFGIECVHYAHAGAGELHLRPNLNLKTHEGQQQFREIAEQVARLVKRFGGSLSGEHGDGRLRAEFLEWMVGPKNYRLLKQIKQLFDPKNIFNPGKIIDAPPMQQNLRFQPGAVTPEIPTVFDFQQEQGILRAAELCNGSGDCRKTALSGGTMCPSYMATRNEMDTTRARANVLRQVLTEPEDPDNPFNSEELKQVMDLCLSCKGCKNECPSNVDIAKMKAEFLQGYYDTHGVPRQVKLVAGFSRAMQIAAWFPGLYNGLIQFPPTAKLLKKMAGFSPRRELPKLGRSTLRHWYQKHTPHPNAGKQGSVVLFCDEFTNFNDVPIGVATIELAERLGFQVILPDHRESGRTALSKGLLRNAKKIANQNVKLLAPLVSDDVPLIGIEPSAILSFRDEYLNLVDPELKNSAIDLASHCLLIDEWIDQLISSDRVNARLFTEDKKRIRLHGHCHQKAISSLAPSVRMLQLPRNYSVRLIPSGCCGMAGSFGYEQEHYELSMKIGELVLFPTVRTEPLENLIAASGTSCRHQIQDGTGRQAFHPVQILRSAFRE
jgi:FAD/FMN-containing dehydrogenase/Fe-S oxidoreductase